MTLSFAKKLFLLVVFFLLLGSSQVPQLGGKEIGIESIAKSRYLSYLHTKDNFDLIQNQEKTVDIKKFNKTDLLNQELQVAADPFGTQVGSFNGVNAYSNYLPPQIDELQEQLLDQYGDSGDFCQNRYTIRRSLEFHEVAASGA